jgi:hypothetical protein
MNSFQEFEFLLSQISDNELYDLAKSCLQLLTSSNYNNQKKLELIYSECKKRDKKIYEKAMNDAFLTTFTTQEKISESSILNIQRIDFMSESEINLLVNLISKSIKKGSMDIASATGISIYKLLGVPEEHLLLFKVSGDSMIEDGISDGDLVVADRRVQIVNKKLVIVEYEGELFIKRILINKGILWLISANEKIKPFQLKGREEIKIIARVKNLIKILQ